MGVLNLNSNLLLLANYKKNRFVIFLVHWLAWLLLHFITFLPTLVNSRIIDWQSFSFRHLFLVSLNFFLFYIVAFSIMPVMMRIKRKWFWIIVGCLVLTVIFTYIMFRLERSFTDYLLSKAPVHGKYSRHPKPVPVGFFSYLFRSYFQFNILTNVSIVITGFAYRLLLTWFQQEKIRKELENQKLRSELSFLKMQVNPHFLFNALNNIYSLAVIENSDKTGSSILRLSELMRYMLYEKEDAEHKVSLVKEIRHINSYIELEKLRHLGNMHVRFSIEGEVNDKRIAPLLIFPLIENAFKHGILTEADKPVTIDLKIDDHHIAFCIENYTNNYQKDSVGGIGVQNVKKRLDLLYGENYRLDIKDESGKFTVKLQLPL